MANELQLLMPMGGKGQRFLSKGFNVPKPLIEFNQVPIFKHALDSVLRENLNIGIVAVVRDFETAISVQELSKTYGLNIKIIGINFDTRGAIETCLLAEPLLDPYKPLLIMDCDIQFANKQLFSIIRESKKESVMHLTLFKSDKSHFSYAKVDGDRVLEAAEKKVISEYAIAGAYYFSEANSFILNSKEILFQNELKGNSEFFLSLLVNKILDNKLAVSWSEGEFVSLGTPEELEAIKTQGLLF